MNKALKIPHGSLVLVGDSRKALFLTNKGDEVYPNLQVERVLNAPDNPPSQQQGTDKPGRVFGLDQRSAVDQTDWHAVAEQKFAAEVADAVNSICADGTVKHIVVAAPPRTLAELRNRFSEAVKQRILAEFNKDLTKIPVYEIERHLVATT